LSEAAKTPAKGEEVKGAAKTPAKVDAKTPAKGEAKTPDKAEEGKGSATKTPAKGEGNVNTPVKTPKRTIKGGIQVEELKVSWVYFNAF
jgi:hypothetical protein